MQVLRIKIKHFLVEILLKINACFDCYSKRKKSKLFFSVSGRERNYTFGLTFILSSNDLKYIGSIGYIKQ